jgi:hypothetical protein
MDSTHRAPLGFRQCHLVFSENAFLQAYHEDTENTEITQSAAEEVSTTTR